MRPLPGEKPNEKGGPDARRRMARDGRDGILLARPCSDRSSRRFRFASRQALEGRPLEGRDAYDSTASVEARSPSDRDNGSGAAASGPPASSFSL